MKDLNLIVKDIVKLPPFPDTAQKVLSLLHDQRSSIKDIVEVISLDQAVTTNILRYCNSAYLGLRRRVGSLHDAIVLLGQDKVHQIVIADCSSRYYQNAGAGYDLEQGELWRHSVASGLLSQILMKQMGLPENSFLFTAALLHDIGKVILSSYVKAEYDRILGLIKKQNYTFIRAEKEIIGIDHAQLGAQILKQWNFPEALVNSVATHHNPETDEDMPYLVHLCNLMTLMLGIGTGYGLADYARDAAMKRLGLKLVQLESCMADLSIELKKAESLLKDTHTV